MRVLSFGVDCALARSFMASQSLQSASGGVRATVRVVFNLFEYKTGAYVVGGTYERTQDSGLGVKMKRIAAASALLILGSGV